MPLSTTVLGSFPKPNYLAVPDWFSTSQSRKCVGSVTKEYTQAIEEGRLTEATFTKAIKEVLDIQTNLGIQVVTDGEVRRENYVFHFCRRLKGIDFVNLTWTSSRNGAWEDELPTIVAKVEPLDAEPWVYKEWTISQDLCDRPVKYTLPGPMTIVNTLVDRYYNDDVALGKQLAGILNQEVKALAEAGCKYIQVSRRWW